MRGDAWVGAFVEVYDPLEILSAGAALNPARPDPAYRLLLGRLDLDAAYHCVHVSSGLGATGQ